MPNTDTLSELRIAASDFALAGARKAADFLGKVEMVRKPDDTPVTEADHAVQAVILAEIARRYPAHAVLSEETVGLPNNQGAVGLSDFCWVIDPIDGTRNFGRGATVYCISVAVLRNGRPVAGAVYDAASRQTYSASLGGGAFCNDRKLTLADRPIDYNTTLAVGSFRHRPIPPAVRDWMDQYLFRNLGSVALHLVWVAAGCLDAAYALECKLWDIAAGSLIVQEAGGLATNHIGRHIWPKDLRTYNGEDIPILTGTPKMHGKLLDSLSRHDNGGGK